jgi:hypothetical protein
MADAAARAAGKAGDVAEGAKSGLSALDNMKVAMKSLKVAAGGLGLYALTDAMFGGSALKNLAGKAGEAAGEAGKGVGEGIGAAGSGFMTGMFGEYWWVILGIVAILFIWLFISLISPPSPPQYYGGFRTILMKKNPRWLTWMAIGALVFAGGYMYAMSRQRQTLKCVAD